MAGRKMPSLYVPLHAFRAHAPVFAEKLSHCGEGQLSCLRPAADLFLLPKDTLTEKHGASLPGNTVFSL